MPTRSKPISHPIPKFPSQSEYFVLILFPLPRAALRTHPDRVASDSPERAERTRKFQQVNDAYYTLSDPSRRRDYDAARIYHGFGSGASSASTAYDSSSEDIPGAGTGDASGSEGWGSFPWSSFGFSSKAKTEEERRKHENEQFGDVFEEMLREEGMAEDGGRPTGKFWSVIGGLSGAAMGFIIANFPGMLAGAVAGNRLGAIRDSRGKSVYAVFQELPQDAKMQLLSQLAVKVFSHVVGP
jgi:curved DNA-binding protein CbpA